MSKSKKITIVDIRADDEVRDAIFDPIIKNKAEAVEDASSENVRDGKHAVPTKDAQSASSNLDVPIEQIVPNEPTVVN